MCMCASVQSAPPQKKVGKYVSLLASLCSCGGKAIVSNQVTVHDLMFKRSAGSLMMPLGLEGGRVCITLPPDCPTKRSPTDLLPTQMPFAQFVEQADIAIFQCVALLSLCACLRVRARPCVWPLLWMPDLSVMWF